MKVEIIETKDHQFSNETWYHIEVDGKLLTGTYSTHEFKTKKLYFEIISDPSVLKPVRNILHSAEFIVSLEDTKTQ